jgi:hypothetical protein
MGNRTYALYVRKRGAWRWKRASVFGYAQDIAIRVYQSSLLDFALGLYPGYEARLRPGPMHSHVEITRADYAA